MKRILPICTLLTAGVLAVAGCSSSGGNSGSQQSGGATGSSLPGPPVKIGIIANVSQTTQFGNPEPEVVSAAQAAVDAINKRGGVAGKQLQLVPCDEKGNANDAAACARSFVSDGVIATVGDATQDGPKYGPILDAAGIPRIGPLALTQAEYTGKLAYPLSSGATGMFVGDLIDAKSQGLSSFNVVALGVPGTSDLLTLLKGAAGPLGLSYKGSENVPLGASDLSPYVTAAKKSGADVVVATLDPATMAQFLQTSQQLGAKYKIATSAESVSQELIDKLGGASGPTEGMLLVSPFPPVTASGFPAIDQFNKEMDAREASGDKNAAASKRPVAFNSWLAVHAFDQVTKDMTSVPTRTSLVAALDKAKDVDMGGVMPPWTPSKSGMVLPRVSNPYGFFDTVKDGKLTLVSDKPVQVLQ